MFRDSSRAIKNAIRKQVAKRMEEGVTVYDSSRAVERVDDAAIEPDSIVMQAGDAVNDWRKAVREASVARGNLNYAHAAAGEGDVETRIETYLQQVLGAALEEAGGYFQVRTPDFRTETPAEYRDTIKKRAERDLGALLGIVEGLPDSGKRAEYKSRLTEGYRRFEEELAAIDVGPAHVVEFMRPSAKCTCC